MGSADCSGAAHRSSLDPRSLGRGLLAIVTQPTLLVVALVLPFLVWLALLAIGFEGSAGELVDVLALPPIATYFDLGTGASVVRVGPAFLVFTAVSVLVRGVVYALLAGMVVEALEDSRVSRYGLLRGIAAIPAVLVVQVDLVLADHRRQALCPILGPGSGSSRSWPPSWRPVLPRVHADRGDPAGTRRARSDPSLRSSGAFPGPRQLLFLRAVLLRGAARGGRARAGQDPARCEPVAAAWVFILAVSVVHLAFAAALAVPVDRGRAAGSSPCASGSRVPSPRDARRRNARGARR